MDWRCVLDGLSNLEIGATVNKTISHDWSEETPEAKARWFQSLTLSERMGLLCSFTDLVLEINPKIAEKKDAQPITGRVRVLRKP